MQFKYSSDWDKGIADLTERLVRELGQGKVLWLLSGGSNVKASVEIMNSITSPLSENLSVLLVDERYGPAGHSDSNWQQLLEAGFQSKQATAWPVLTDNLSFTETATKYNELARQRLDEAGVVIAQLGIGSDGHIAGILPGSSAANEEKATVVGYDSETYQRLTMTFPALEQIDVAYVFAFGQSKAEALKQLHDKQLPRQQQPAQVLRNLPEAYIYNDQIGE
jgi:6-phosphogluconolactonase